MPASSSSGRMSADRARACLIALAAGDALGAPTEGMERDAIAASFGRVSDEFAADAAGTDDTEYAVLTAWALLRNPGELRSPQVAALWLEALDVQDGGFAGAGFSEMVALANLRAGVQPPASGRNNPERWSDGAAMRAAPIGIVCAGDPVSARRLAVADASVSHADDGIFCAEAVAAAVAVAMGGAGWRAAVAAAVAALPEDSWSARTVARALAVVAAAPDSEAAEAELYRSISIFHYPWADAAPEALALTLGVVVIHEGRVRDAVLAGVNMGRDSDTIAAMAGAICGAAAGMAGLPDHWLGRVRSVQGRCITATAGADLVELADALVDASKARGMNG